MNTDIEFVTDTHLFGIHIIMLHLMICVMIIIIICELYDNMQNFFRVNNMLFNFKYVASDGFFIRKIY